MFRDAQEELKRLEAQLLAEEPQKAGTPEAPEEGEQAPAQELTDEELAQIRQLLRDPEPQYEIRNYANHYQTEAERAETEASEEAPIDRWRIPLAVLAFLILAGTVALVVLWLARAGGLL